MNANNNPHLFIFIVEGIGSVDVYAHSYTEAYQKLEKQVGFNVYGKCYLERECLGNEIHHRNWRG